MHAIRNNNDCVRAGAAAAPVPAARLLLQLSAMDLRDQLQTTLGDSYTLERELTGGGMSRVFVAEERTLGRKIVVKVVPPDRAAGVSVQRFKREIQVAARLQHPHIVPLLSAGETDGLPFYTMPFVKGESVRTRLSRGGEMSVNEALHVLRDVASALAYAHAEGVVHRDIKPDNVIISGGVAVVTDFGVAKAMDLAATDAGAPQTGLTSLGIALGTPAYMSPEQASADPHVDHRADIYSFGCVAYELLTGASPFAGRPPQQMLAAHVTEDAEPLIKRRPTVPPALSALVMHCLQKRAGDRPQSATDILTELDAIATPSGGTSPTAARVQSVTTPGVRRRWWIATAAIVIIAGTVAALLWNRASTAFQVGATTPVAVGPAFEWHPAISPDGRFVAYSARTAQGLRIFSRQIDGGRAVMLTGDLAGNHDWPKWSPDGSRLMFVADNSGIYVIPSFGGGAARRVLQSSQPGVLLLSASWSPDGKSIGFTDATGLRVQSVDGGAPRLVAAGSAFHAPVWSPDGQFIAYVDGQALTLGNVSTSSILVVSAAGGEPTRVTDVLHVNESPAWAPDGRSLFYVSSLGGTLDIYQQAIRRGGAPVGAPVRLTTGLSPFSVSVARDGSRAAYDVVRLQSNIVTVTLPREGAASMSAAQPVTSENQIVENVALSHDGKWLVYDSNRGGNYDIYKVRAEGGEPIQLTSDPANDFGPSWSPDDRELVFHSTRSGTRDLYLMSDEGGGERAITSGPTEDLVGRFSPDGRQIAYVVLDSMFTLTVITRTADGSWSAPRAIARYQDMFAPGTYWSPDGKSLVVTRASGVWIVPVNGGAPRPTIDQKTFGALTLSARWGRDPNVLYVVAGPRQFSPSSIWAVPLKGGQPRRVVAGDSSYTMYREYFDTDGRRFFLTMLKAEGDVWVMQLKR
jgi:Tol biopolymer transport system component